MEQINTCQDKIFVIQNEKYEQNSLSQNQKEILKVMNQNKNGEISTQNYNEEEKNAIEENRHGIELSDNNENEYAVRLKMGDSDDEPNYKLFPLNPPKVQKEEPIPVSEPPKTEVVLKQYIIQLINDRHAKQMLIDKGEFVKKGPGRHRK